MGGIAMALFYRKRRRIQYRAGGVYVTHQCCSLAAREPHQHPSGEEYGSPATASGAGACRSSMCGYSRCRSNAMEHVAPAPPHSAKSTCKQARGSTLNAAATARMCAMSH